MVNFIHPSEMSFKVRAAKGSGFYAMSLRNVIRYQLVFNLNDPVTQQQFALFQPRPAKLVMAPLFGQRGNRFIKVTMFYLEQFKPLPQLLVGYPHVAPIRLLPACNKFVIFILFMDYVETKTIMP